MIKDFAFRQKSDKYEICFIKWVWQTPLPFFKLLLPYSTNRQLLMHIQSNFGILRGKMWLKVINSGLKMICLLYNYWDKLTNNLIEPIPPNNFNSWDQNSRYTHIYLFLFTSRGSGYLSHNVLILLSIKN